MIKYGVEHITKEHDRIVMYKSKERAIVEAEKIVKEMKDGDSVMLFYADCDDAGKLATNEFNILKVWN